MYHSPYYGTEDSEEGHLDFLSWLDIFCESPAEAKLEDWFLSKPKDERKALIHDGYDERARRINDEVC